MQGLSGTPVLPIRLPRSLSRSAANPLVFSLFSPIPSCFCPFTLLPFFGLLSPLPPAPRFPPPPRPLHLPQSFFRRRSQYPSTPWPSSSPTPTAACMPSTPPYSMACSLSYETTMPRLARGWMTSWRISGLSSWSAPSPCCTHSAGSPPTSCCVSHTWPQLPMALCTPSGTHPAASACR